MVKIILGLFGYTLMLFSQSPSLKLQQNCLVCHQTQEIPSELIYRRYLMKYSTHGAIKTTLLEYLQNPKKENSIMPKQFFIKFPFKEKNDLNITELEQSIDDYLDYFDVTKKLVLPKYSVKHLKN